MIRILEQLEPIDLSVLMDNLPDGMRLYKNRCGLWEMDAMVWVDGKLYGLNEVQHTYTSPERNEPFHNFIARCMEAFIYCGLEKFDNATVIRRFDHIKKLDSLAKKRRDKPVC